MICCAICCWNNATMIYDDSIFAHPPIGSKLYEIWKYSGYNHVVNTSSYNPCDCCIQCYLFTLIGCDQEKQIGVLNEVKQNYEIKKIMIKFGIPNELFKIIYKFIN